MSQGYRLPSHALHKVTLERAQPARTITQCVTSMVRAWHDMNRKVEKAKAMGDTFRADMYQGKANAMRERIIGLGSLAYGDKPLVYEPDNISRTRAHGLSSKCRKHERQSDFASKGKVDSIDF